MNCFDITGVFSNTDPFDNNISLPATSGSTTAGSTATYSTTQPDDLLLWIEVFPLGFSGSSNSGAGFATVSGGSPGGTLGAGNVSLFNWVFYKSVSAAQTSQTVITGTSSGGEGAIGMLIALTADAKGVKFQTFVTCF